MVFFEAQSPSQNTTTIGKMVFFRTVTSPPPNKNCVNLRIAIGTTGAGLRRGHSGGDVPLQAYRDTSTYTTRLNPTAFFTKVRWVCT